MHSCPLLLRENQEKGGITYVETEPGFSGREKGNENTITASFHLPPASWGDGNL